MPSSPAVVSRIDRADEQHVKELTKLGVATVHSLRTILWDSTTPV